MMKKRHHTQIMAPGFPQLQSPQPNRPQLSQTLQPTVLPSEAGSSVTASVPAKSGPASDNPYQSIVTRNVFGLNPIPPSVPEIQQPGPPPPKITLTGITTIFGPAEALFKVAGVVRSGGPPKDEYYTFTEGEEEDEVSVTKIDIKGNIVTFMNHGVEQAIPLSAGVASSGSAPPAPSWPGQNGGLRRFKRGFFPGGFQPPQPNQPPQPYGNPYGNGNNSSAQNGNNPSGMFNNNYATSGSTPQNLGANISPAVSQLSDEDQQALIAAQHAQMTQQGDPMAPAMPPTAFDQQAADESKK